MKVLMRVPAVQIRAELTQTVKQVQEWFEKNPERRMMRAQVWQDHIVKVKRHRVYEDLWTASERIIHENRNAGFFE